MRILVAPDSFKGNMSAPVVCSIIEAGILRRIKKRKYIKYRWLTEAREPQGR